LFLTSEAFTNELIQAIRNEKTTTDISEVSDWLSKKSAVTTGKTGGKFISICKNLGMTKKLLIQ
jgi:uncharacterized membrane-anchored protein